MKSAVTRTVVVVVIVEAWFAMHCWWHTPSSAISNLISWGQKTGTSLTERWTITYQVVPGHINLYVYSNCTGREVNFADFILHHISSSITSKGMNSSWFSESLAFTSMAPRTIDSTSMKAVSEICLARTRRNRKVLSLWTRSSRGIRSSIGMMRAIWRVSFATKTPKT